MVDTDLGCDMFILVYRDRIKELELDCMEVEFVHGVRIKREEAEEAGKAAAELGVTLTCHGPYYINLNSDEARKREASVKRILDTARAAHWLGAVSITFHAAFFMKKDPEEVYQVVRQALADISAYDAVKENAKHPDVWIKDGATFPVISLVFSTGNFEHETGNALWSEAHKTRVEFEIHLIITESDDNLSREFLGQFADIQSAIMTLTEESSFNEKARIYLADVQVAIAETGAWLWAVMRLVAGE